mmetsp:Transcript_37751/g.95635  ORF Transcript_37751/g.95635 Transcript_37751/m.95635 type:complete len:237 (-) Transcript_37751:48-758(-)
MTSRHGCRHHVRGRGPTSKRRSATWTSPRRVTITMMRTMAVLQSVWARCSVCLLSRRWMSARSCDDTSQNSRIGRRWRRSSANTGAPRGLGLCGGFWRSFWMPGLPPAQRRDVRPSRNRWPATASKSQGRRSQGGRSRAEHRSSARSCDRKLWSSWHANQWPSHHHVHAACLFFSTPASGLCSRSAFAGDRRASAYPRYCLLEVVSRAWLVSRRDHPSPKHAVFDRLLKHEALRAE